MKKLLSLAALLTLVACNSNTSNNNPSNESTPEASTGTGIIYKTTSSVTGQTYLYVDYLNDNGRSFLRPGFENVSNIQVWKNLVAYVKQNDNGKSEVFVLNIDTEEEHQVSELNDENSNIVPELEAFAHGKIVITSKSKHLEVMGNPITYQHMLIADLNNGVEAANWRSLGSINYDDVEAVVHVSQEGFYGYMTTTAGGKKVFNYYPLEDGTWNFSSKCSGYTYSCDRPMTLVGIRGREILYIGTDDTTNTNVALRGTMGNVIADNLTNGYNSITQMVTLNNINYFVAYDGVNYKVHTLDEANTNLVTAYSHPNVTSIFTDGTYLYSTTLTGGFYQNSMPIAASGATKATVIGNRAYHMGNNNNTEYSFTGVSTVINLHSVKGVAASNFGPVIDGKMYFANYVSPMVNVIAEYDIETNTTTNRYEDHENITFLQKFSF